MVGCKHRSFRASIRRHACIENDEVIMACLDTRVDIDDSTITKVCTYVLYFLWLNVGLELEKNNMNDGHA